MILTEQIQKALNFSATKHQGQTRKGSGLPFIIHPFSVVIILSQYTQNEKIIVASLLHDVIEDVEGCSYEDLKNNFGEKVASIVLEISEECDDLDDKKTDRETWQERKNEYLQNLWNDNEEALLICAADKIHNLKSMIMIYEEQGDAMWVDFNAPLEKQIWYYDEVLKILKEKLDNEIVEELEREFEEFKKVVGKNL